MDVSKYNSGLKDLFVFEVFKTFLVLRPEKFQDHETQDQHQDLEETVLRPIAMVDIFDLMALASL